MLNPNTNPSNLHNNDSQILVELIKQDPRYYHLYELVKQGKPLPPENKTWVQQVVSVLIASPKDYYGTARVNKELKNQAAMTANINTVANWVDFVSNFPFYFYSFKFLGGIPAFMLGLLLDGCMLWICNLTASVTANRQKHNGSWAKMGINGMVALSIVKSLVSGVGVELLNNQSGLNQQMANQLIDERIQQVEKLKKLDDPQYLNTLKRCEDGRKELEKMERNHPRRDSLYQELFGSWDDRNRSWTDVPLEQMPLCKRLEHLEQRAYASYLAAKNTLNQQLVRRVDMGNDLAFLKQEMPEIYKKAFTDSGDVSTAEIASAIEAVRLATENFFGKIIRGEFASLGFSMFFFSLSVITSTVAVLITIKYAEREDVQKSRDEKIAKARDLWLEQRWQELVQSHRNASLQKPLASNHEEE